MLLIDLIYAILIAILSSCAVASSAGNDANIAFDLPDVTATIESSTGTFQLEAYRSVKNDEIMRAADTARKSELFWVSVGHPSFVKTPMWHSEKLRLFHFSYSGFSSYIEMMNDDQRHILATAARSKYRLSVADNQIVNLVLSSFECSLKLYDSVGKKHLIKGSVSTFRHFPLRIDFEAPINSAERLLFEQIVGVNESLVDLKFNCEMSSTGKVIKTNTLIITSEQQQQIGLEENLFGPSGKDQQDNVYVSRNQMTQLASEMYSTLNIFEEYQMPEVEFKEEFVNGIIQQAFTEYYFIHVSCSTPSRLCNIHDYEAFSARKQTTSYFQCQISILSFLDLAIIGNVISTSQLQVLQ